MSSQAWHNFVSVQTAIVATVTTRVYNFILVPESQLELCGKELDDMDDIKTYINDLSPDQREHLRNAAERGQYTNIETLKYELQR
jgi:hypothetical protein